MKQSNSTPNRVFFINKFANGLFIAVLFIIIGCNSNDNSETTDSSINSSKLNHYNEYLDGARDRIEKFSEEEKNRRQEIIDKIQNTNTYDSLVKNKIVSANYIPIISAIANGITYININGFAIDRELILNLHEFPDGEDKEIFALNAGALAQPLQGGLNKELIELFERYRIKYNLYGEPSVQYNANGELKEKIPFNYDFTPIFAMLEPKNKNFIEAIYKAKVKGLSTWENRDSDSLEYAFMTNPREYGKKLLSVNPWSNLLPKGIDDNFWTKYDPTVKERALGFILSKDCKGLQEEFSTTADNLDKFHKAGKTSSRNLDYMNFLDTQLKKLGCYKD